MVSNIVQIVKGLNKLFDTNQIQWLTRLFSQIHVKNVPPLITLCNIVLSPIVDEWAIDSRYNRLLVNIWNESGLRLKTLFKGLILMKLLKVLTCVKTVSTRECLLKRFNIIPKYTNYVDKWHKMTLSTTHCICLPWCVILSLFGQMSLYIGDKDIFNSHIIWINLVTLHHFMVKSN